MAILCDAPLANVKEAGRKVLLQPLWDEKTQKLARDWARDVARDVARDWARDWARDVAHDWVHDWANWASVARDWARDVATDWAYGYLARAVAGDMAREVATGWARDLARDLARDVPRHIPTDWASGWARYWAQYWAKHWKLYPAPRWLEPFSMTEQWSLGRSSPRATLANIAIGGPPELRVLSAASRLSLNPQSDPEPFAQALAQHGPTMDPLWPALARHLARRSTADDRALLIDLAQHPEKREPPLCWGLQFIVRGDLIFDGGKILTLDELADEVGVPRLPYLEDLPDELELDEPE